MIFNSYVFIFIFLPCSLCFFHLLRDHLGVGVAMKFLSACSIIYYGWWNPPYVLLLLASIVLNFAFGKAISASPKPKRLLCLGIAFNLLLLGYYKYAGFIVSNINYLCEIDYLINEILLPIGISFFTFQQIAYLSDLSRGKCKSYRFSDYFLFVTFYPQLIAGPIVHHSEMMPQFQKNRKTERSGDFAIGSTLFIIGLSKKVIIADSLAPYASMTFGHAADGVAFNIFEAWIASLSYTFQLYFDFSGYSDMAMGIAAMFGIFLPVNFLSPYKATSLIDFWRRWHITLSRFLRDYLYIPLGGNRKGKPRELANLFVTMAIGGLWHGANWTFVLWGVLHGVGLSINHLCSKFTRKPRLGILFGFLTFLFVSFSWVLFRAEDLESASLMYSTMLALDGLILPAEMLTEFPIEGAAYAGEFHNTPIAIILLSAIIAFVAPNSLQIINAKEFDLPINIRSTSFHWRPNMKWLAFILLLFIGCLLNMSELSEFLYYQF